MRVEQQVREVTPQRVVTGTGGGQSNVVGGATEPNYKYPWVVRITSGGCHGVLIAPNWVLTAAHCVTPGLGDHRVSYSRTDAYSNRVEEDDSLPAGANPQAGVTLHPEFDAFNGLHDIALIRLAQPFTISPMIQTVALPRTSRNPGVVGTVASFSHNGALPAGQSAVFRAPIQRDDFALKFIIPASAAGSSLCPGDSGSGFVTMESGRATVRGIASMGTVSECMEVGGEAEFTDVFAHRDWILQTMATTDAALAGNTRIRWNGRAARGTIGLGCINPHGTLWGPLNVAGVEESALCETGQTQTAICTISGRQNAGPSGVAITGFTMRTISASGVQSQALPFTPTSASFYGILPAGVTREFICHTGAPNTAVVTDAVRAAQVR